MSAQTCHCGSPAAEGMVHGETVCFVDPDNRVPPPVSVDASHSAFAEALRSLDKNPALPKLAALIAGAAERSEPSLLPCPFCGGKADYKTDPEDEAALLVGCDGCGASSAWGYSIKDDCRDHLRLLWNRRTQIAKAVLS